MQISRHWRLNSQRYRLEGVRYENGECKLQARVVPNVNVVESVPARNPEGAPIRVENKVPVIPDAAEQIVAVAVESLK